MALQSGNFCVCSYHCKLVGVCIKCSRKFKIMFVALVFALFTVGCLTILAVFCLIPADATGTFNGASVQLTGVK